MRKRTVKEGRGGGETIALGKVEKEGLEFKEREKNQTKKEELPPLPPPKK